MRNVVFESVTNEFNGKGSRDVKVRPWRFCRPREILVTHKDLANKLAMLERKYDAQFKVVFDAILQLMTPPEPKKAEDRLSG